MVDDFAIKIFDDQLRSNSSFKNQFFELFENNLEHAEKVEKLTKSESEIDYTQLAFESMRWTKDGIIKATRDFLMEYIDLYNMLSGIKLSDIAGSNFSVGQISPIKLT